MTDEHPLWPLRLTPSAPVLGSLIFRCTITCDVCRTSEPFASREGEEDLDRQIKAHGWKRFGPSGSDLCFKCRGSSPNTIIQVKR